MSQATQLTADGEPAEISETVEAYGETFHTLVHRETGEELGTVTEADLPGASQ